MSFAETHFGTGVWYQE